MSESTRGMGERKIERETEMGERKIERETGAGERQRQVERQGRKRKNYKHKKILGILSCRASIRLP